MMKKLLLTLLLLNTIPALADYSCTTTSWSPGLFGSYYLSGLPHSFGVKQTEGKYQIPSLVVDTTSAHFGTLENVMNIDIHCRKGSCYLDATVTEIIHGTQGNASGFHTQYRVSIGEKGEKLVPMWNDRVLKVSCETNEGPATPTQSNQ